MIIKLIKETTLNSTRFSLLSKSERTLEIDVDGVRLNIDLIDSISAIYSFNSSRFIFISRDNQIYIASLFEEFKTLNINGFEVALDADRLIIDYKNSSLQRELKSYDFFALKLNGKSLAVLRADSNSYYLIDAIHHSIEEELLNDLEEFVLKERVESLKYEYLKVVENSVTLKEIPLGDIPKIELFDDKKNKIKDIYHFRGEYSIDKNIVNIVDENGNFALITYLSN